MAEEQNRRSQSQTSQHGETAVDATRHIGKTLEAEGNFANVLGTELPIDKTLRHSPDAAHPETDTDNPTDAMDVRSLGEDKRYQHGVNREDRLRSKDEPVSRLNPDAATLHSLSDRLNEKPEKIKTRLPGDTSSDPHTDLGPDNATNTQRRAG